MRDEREAFCAGVSVPTLFGGGLTWTRMCANVFNSFWKICLFLFRINGMKNAHVDSNKFRLSFLLHIGLFITRIIFN